MLLTSILSLFSSVRLGSSSPNTEFKSPLINGEENKTKISEQLTVKKERKYKTLSNLTAAQSFRKEDESLQVALRTDKSIVTWDSVVNMVKRRESLQLKPYICPGGHLSIGYGHLITKGEECLKNGITEVQADSLLYNDMKYYRDWVQKTLKLKGNQLKAITHFCYAFGTTKLLKSALYDQIKAQEPIDEQIVKWVNINKRPNASLLRQRNLELAWYNKK
jgi:GH24 family phage-related lysozyme (muramidase)